MSLDSLYPLRVCSRSGTGRTSLARPRFSAALGDRLLDVAPRECRGVDEAAVGRVG